RPRERCSTGPAVPIRRPPSSTPFPYTTLFRSNRVDELTREIGRQHIGDGRQHDEDENGQHQQRLAPPITAGIGQYGAEGVGSPEDRKSTRLNSSHVKISYAVFCLKKKKKATSQ